ncbi:MAG TPA: hypothetical protein VMC09_17240 [Anaerolineales bacterium]|nr:hypothetical protein [Anaerolineales bacterium]
MAHSRRKRPLTLAKKYPPSEPCGCAVCLGYCNRPGWWSVEEAGRAVDGGYAHRMMLEFSPDRSFGVLSPAFRGNEMGFATQQAAPAGCNFLKDNLCELHGTGFQPLECRFCHHERVGLGPRCHADLERDWNTRAGQSLVVYWGGLTGLWERYHLLRPEK